MLSSFKWVLLIVGLLGVAGADWPRFRGPAGDGKAEEGLPLKWSATEGVAWKKEMPGPGASSPIVWQNKVFLTCYSGYGLDPKQAGDMEQLKRHAICMNAENGETLWAKEIPADLPETKYQGTYITTHGYASSTPVTDGERVYFFFNKSGVFAYSMDGELAWKKTVGNTNHEWGNGASPILHGDLLIVNAGIEGDNLLALNKNTGEQVWTLGNFPRAWNTPALVTVPESKRQELIVSVRGKVRGIDPLKGTELWSSTGISTAELCPSPVVHEDVAYITGGPGGESLAVRIGGNGDVTKTNLLWRIRKGSNVTSPIYHNGHLFWASDSRGILYCANPVTGDIVYETRLNPRSERIYASPILSGDRLYFVSRSNGTFVVAAKPEFELLAHNVLSTDPTEIFNGSPAVHQGRLLIRSDKFLYCISGK